MKKVVSLLKTHWFFFSFLGLIALIAILYTVGLRVGPGPSIVRVGTLLISDVPEQTEVYVDDTRRAAVVGGVARIALSPGPHTVIIAAPEAQPWSELVLIESGESFEVSPILAPTSIHGEKLAGADAEAARKAILAYKLPLKAGPLSLASGCALVYTAQNRIVAEATTTETCTTPPDYLCIGEGCATTVIFPPTGTLRSVSPLPGRDDALLVSSGNMVYVLELDPRDPRFFAPLYKGIAPIGIPGTDGKILVQDGKLFYQLSL